jgi:molybdenum cofactor biosynthesis enzyme MoaA
MKNPRRPGVGRQPHALSAADCVEIINAFTALGGRQVNITGGEPLAHPALDEILAGIEKRGSRTVLNTNGILAERLLSRPRYEALDDLFISLHTTDEAVFSASLGRRAASRVMENILALKAAGYGVQLNLSLGAYNLGGFEGVLAFAAASGIDLKAIALVRSSEAPGFYGGEWVGPSRLEAALLAAGARRVEERQSFGGHTTVYALGGSTVKVKDVARGRLETDFCRGCSLKAMCGEGVYGVRVGVDGLWKPCLLRRERYSPVARGGYRRQILEVIDAMIGRWSCARFVTGAPA